MDIRAVQTCPTAFVNRGQHAFAKENQHRPLDDQLGPCSGAAAKEIHDPAREADIVVLR